jgi:hypothetical protein
MSVAEERRVAASTCGQQLRRDENGIFPLGVRRDILEDVDELQRFSESLAVPEQPCVHPITDENAMRAPKIGEQMPDRAGDEIAVLAKFGRRRNTNAGRIDEHEPAHSIVSAMRHSR